MKQPYALSHLPRTDVRTAWQQQLQDQRDTQLAEDLMRREHELLPRFGSYYQRLQALPRRWRRGIGRRLRQSLAGVALLLALGHGAAFAATINVDGTVCTLADAITAANTDTATGGCPAGSGADTLNITTDITLTNELPTIVGGVTIEGNGNTVERSSAAGTPDFRILRVDESGALTLNEATITGGSVSGTGGGIASSGDLTISGSTISGNTAGGEGGGVYVYGEPVEYGEPVVELTITDSTISGNTAGREGGGVALSPGYLPYGGYPSLPNPSVVLTISGSTISGNTAGGRGGGVFAPEAVAGMTITDSTISGNTAEEGGGVYLGYSHGTIENTTVSGNVANEIGGGIFVGTAYWSDCCFLGQLYGGEIVVRNTVVSGNTSSGGAELATPCVEGFTPHFSVWGSGYVRSQGYNLFGESSNANADAFEDGGSSPDEHECGPSIEFAPTDIIATSDGNNPTALENILEPTLGDNGGLTKTLALVAGSPAIDAAGPDCPPPDTDQRGFPRPQGGACDIGAFEGTVGLINDRVTFNPNPSTYPTTRNKTGCPSNYWGKYLFEARLANVGGQDLNALSVEIEKLTRKNLVLAPDGTLLGAGDRLSVPREDDYADGILSPSETVDMPFKICLKRRQSFQFFVDAYGSVSSGVPGPRR